MFCTHCGNQIDASGVLPLVVEHYAEGNKSWGVTVYSVLQVALQLRKIPPINRKNNVYASAQIRDACLSRNFLFMNEQKFLIL